MNPKQLEQFESLVSRQSSIEVLSELVNQQVKNWPLAGANYQGLDKVKVKEFEFEGFLIKVQFNSERIRSSAAKVDKTSIQNRACFLCMNQLPAEQKGIAFRDDFVILTNPFPIIPQHFTIPKIDHVDQSFLENLESMLFLAKEMKGYTLFYNGPKCGASAPDHMHFQAGSKGFMPVEEEYFKLKNKANILQKDSKVEIRAFPNYLRKMIVVESSDRGEMKKSVERFYQTLADMQSDNTEPMLNAICFYSDRKYIMYLFPRKLHRPWQYFEQDEKQLLISPASVDFGGVFITPRREDFEKITAEDIKDIFRQVSLDEDSFSLLCEKLKD